MAKKEVPEYANVIKNKVKLLRQYQEEKEYAIKVRQSKIANWMKNEELYNGVVQKTLLTRSNLHVPVVFEGVNTMSSKIGGAPDPKYDTIPEGDEMAAPTMEHVIKQDLHDCQFDTIFDDSKIEAGIYGRAIYKVIPGNDKQRIELVDTLAFLISPIARNTKKALYMGQQFIYKTLEELYEESKDMEYDEEELGKLKENKVPAESQRENSSETSAKNLRFAQMGLSNTTQYGSKVAEITEWWTYVKEGKKRELYVLTVANDLYLLRAKRAKDLGLTGKAYRPPFFSWGTYPRGITFWCPSVADVYRDPNLAVDVATNQTIDNNTYRNFGMIFTASNSGLKTPSLVPRPLGVTVITTGPNEKIQDKIFPYNPPEITQGLALADRIKGLADTASGLNVQPPTQKGKMSVTQQAKMYADLEMKMNGIRRNAELCCEDMFQFMADVASEKMTKPRKVKIFGYKNLTLESVTKDNFKDVTLVAKAVSPEDAQQNKAIKQKAAIELFNLFKDDPKVPGQLALRRSIAKKFDIDPDELQSWFEQEDQAEDMPMQTDKAEGDIPQTADQPLVSQTQKGAKAQVPPTI